MPNRSQDSVVFDQKDARHLKAISHQLTEPVTGKDGRLKTSPPDGRTEQLTEAASIEAVRPVKLTVRVADTRKILQAIFGEEASPLRLASHVDQHRHDVLGLEPCSLLGQVR